MKITKFGRLLPLLSTDVVAILVGRSEPYRVECQLKAFRLSCEVWMKESDSFTQPLRATGLG